MPSPPPSDSPHDPASRSALPFEPKSRKKPEKKLEKKAAIAPDAKSASSDKGSSGKDNQEPGSNRLTAAQRADMAIPKVVSQRMARRMALFCGIPSALGMSTFFASYLIVANDLFAIPNVFVVLISMGCFGLGVLGLSYGVISASWDEEAPGSKLGWSEFKVNLGRLTETWRSTRKKS